MMTTPLPRILIVDDNPDIHNDFRKVLLGDKDGSDLADMEAALFGEPASRAVQSEFEIDSAYQGQQALAMVQSAIAEQRPYRMAFVDVRMPPGWDGVETIAEIRKVDPNMHFVICTAYSDYTPAAAQQKVGLRDGLLFIAKPFDLTLVRKLADALHRTPIIRAA